MLPVFEKQIEQQEEEEDGFLSLEVRRALNDDEDAYLYYLYFSHLSIAILILLKHHFGSWGPGALVTS